MITLNVQTDQQAFDAVVAHLAQQGRRSLTGDGDHCAYRSPEGLKCAIGALIPDDQYVASLELKGIGALTSAGRVDVGAVSTWLLKDLQVTHDNFLDDRPGGTNYERLIIRLREVADRYGLNPSAIDLLRGAR